MNQYYVFWGAINHKLNTLPKKLAAAQKWGLLNQDDPWVVYLESFSYGGIDISVYRWLLYIVQRYIFKNNYFLAHSVQAWIELAEEILLPIDTKLQECEKMHNPE